MSRIISALALLLALAACGGGYNSPPRDLDNACSIVTERPKYLRAFQDTERRWGVPIHVQIDTAHMGVGAAGLWAAQVWAVAPQFLVTPGKAPWTYKLWLKPLQAGVDGVGALLTQ